MTSISIIKTTILETHLNTNGTCIPFRFLCWMIIPMNLIPVISLYRLFSLDLVPVFQLISFARCLSRKTELHGDEYPSRNIYCNKVPSQVPVFCFSYFGDVKKTCLFVSLRSSTCFLSFLLNGNIGALSEALEI